MVDLDEELLAQAQHDFGEGPYLQAYAQDRAVVIQDLGAAPVWVRLAAVVGQLRVLAVLSVPIRLASQPVGTLDVYSTQPRAWTTHELEGQPSSRRWPASWSTPAWSWPAGSWRWPSCARR